MTHHDWIVFDSTGTLMIPDPEAAAVYADAGGLADVDGVRRRLKEAMRCHFLGENAHLPTDEANERQRWRKIIRDTLEIEGSRLETVFGSLWHRFSQPENWRLFDDAIPTLEALRESGYRIAVASNFDGRLRTVQQGMAIDSYFDEVLISSELGWSKPNTKFYDAATEKLGQSDRSRIMMIGDTLEGDVIAAKAAGWDARHLVRNRDAALLALTSDL